MGTYSGIMQWLSFWDPYVCYQIIPGTVPIIKEGIPHNSKMHQL